MNRFVITLCLILLRHSQCYWCMVPPLSGCDEVVVRWFHWLHYYRFYFIVEWSMSLLKAGGSPVGSSFASDFLSIPDDFDCYLNCFYHHCPSSPHHSARTSYYGTVSPPLAIGPVDT